MAIIWLAMERWDKAMHNWKIILAKGLGGNLLSHLVLFHVSQTDGSFANCVQLNVGILS